MDTKKLNLKLHTFGCKVNTYDTGLLEKRLQNDGFVDSELGPKVYVLNTCAVTQEATNEAVRLVRRLKRQDPDSKVVITGCGAQVDSKSFDELQGVDLIVANSHKGEFTQILHDHLSLKSTEKVFRSNIFRKDDLGEGGGIESQHSRSFLKIQDGCNSFCSYCIIPYARGTSRSLSINSLIERVNELYRNGVREVVLTGVHIGDYEDRDTTNSSDSQNGPSKIEDLIENLLNFTKMPRFRLTSLEPPELTDRLLKLFMNDRLCSHFHMSIQSANSQILKSMKRQYTAEDVEVALLKISTHVPNAFVGMDIIVGFPGETDEHFLDTYKRVESLPWGRLHVFPYSERPGTKATLLSEIVYPHVRKERALKLRQLSAERFSIQALKQLGSIKKGLPIKNKAQVYDRVLTRDYWTCLLDQPILTSNDSVRAEEIDIEVIGFDRHVGTASEGLLRARFIEPNRSIQLDRDVMLIKSPMPLSIDERAEV